jgi:phosphoribosylformylglycinamidine synthase
VAGTAAYCVGNLHIPGYDLPWEDRSAAYPDNLAPPLQIEIEASNGASDYGAAGVYQIFRHAAAER